MNWIHRLFNPHCESCYDELRDSKVCNSCEVLKSTVTRLQFENERLLNNILIKPVEEARVSTENLRPIMPKHIPWTVKRQMLETEDRAKAVLLKTKTEELETSLGIKEEDKNVS